MKNLLSIILILILSGVHSSLVLAESNESIYPSGNSTYTNLPEGYQSQSTPLEVFNHSFTNNALPSSYSTGDPNDDDFTLGGVTEVPVDNSLAIFSIGIFSYFSLLYYREKK